METLEAPTDERVEIERPLASYTALMATFSTVFGGAIVLAAAVWRMAPELRQERVS